MGYTGTMRICDVSRRVLTASPERAASQAGEARMKSVPSVVYLSYPLSGSPP